MTKTARLIICLVGVVVAGNNTWSQTEPPSGKVVAQVVAQEPSPMAGETTLEGDTFSYEESFITQGAAYTYPTTSISETQIPADAPERTVRFDNNVVTLTFPGVNPLSNYNLELSFLSDTNDRVEQVSAGGQSWKVR